jgi:hypothetical protein
MSRNRHLGIRRLLRQRWEEDEPGQKPRRLPPPTVASPWSAEAQAILARGEVIAAEPILTGSNYTFMLALGEQQGARCLAVYKPRRGEVPLWDFPDGSLYRREYAAYLVSQALGWRFVPPTVIRDGPFGIGSVQFYVAPADGVSFLHFRGHHRRELRQITLFDSLVNNADRKVSHLIKDRAGQVWGIDHGLTFHEEWKLRTVVFDFRGQPIPPELLRDLRELRSDCLRVAHLQAQLSSLLDGREIAVLFERLDELLARRAFPDLDPYLNVPRGFF